MDEYINLIVPSQIKDSILKLNLKLKIHFYSIEDIYDILTFTYDDNDALLYAYKENITYTDSLSILEELRSYYYNDELLKKKNEAINNNYLHENYIKKHELKEYKIYIIGYSNYENLGFKQLLNDNDIRYEYISLIDFFDAYNIEFQLNNKINIVQKYDEVFKECMDCLNDIALNIKNDLDNNKEFNSSDYLICCPQGYLKTLIPTAKLYNLNINSNFKKCINTKGINEIINNFLDTLDTNILIKENERLKSENINNDYSLAFSTLLKAIIKILPSFNKIIEELKNSKDESINNKKELFVSNLKDYLVSKLQSNIIKEKYIDGIPVITSLNSLTNEKYVYILGFSSSLLSASKDKTYLDDIEKTNKSYNLKSTDKNLNNVSSISTNVLLIPSIKISYSSLDPLTKYEQTPFDVTNIKYSKDFKKDEGNIKSISANNCSNILYASIFNERYQKTRDQNPLFVYLITNKEMNVKEEINTYNNEFKCKDKNFFNDFFDTKLSSKISHTSLDTYLNNPFDYFCKYYLGIKKPAKGLNMDFGNLAHEYIESGFSNSFNKDEEIKKIVEKLPKEQINYATYFLNKGLSNLETYIKPAIDELRNDDCIEGVTSGYYKQLILDGDEKEFVDTIKIKSLDPNKKDFYVTIKLDGIFIEKTTSEIKNCFIVDYKTSSNPDNYYKTNDCIYGRKQQLPLYALMFNNLKEKYSELKNTELIGAFIMPLYSKTTAIKTKKITGINSSQLLTGTCLNEKEFKNMSILVNYANVSKSFVTEDKKTKLVRLSGNLHEGVKALKNTGNLYKTIESFNYDLDKFNVNFDLAFDEKSLSTDLKDYVRYSLLNVCAFELMYTVDQIRNSNFNINPAYKGKSPFGYGDYKEISYEKRNQRHILNDGRGDKNGCFNDFTSLDKKEEAFNEFNEENSDENSDEEED